jgi:hypothetical protein
VLWTSAITLGVAALLFQQMVVDAFSPWRRIWRWLTCGHTHHRWTLLPALALDMPPTGTDSGYCLLVRTCRRCGLTWEME